MFVLLAPVCQAQEIEFPSPIDFGLVDTEVEVSTQQVVQGRALLYGAVDLDLLQDLALNTRSALSLLCSPQTGDAMGMLMPVTSYITQDIMTMNKRIVGFRIDFRILPALDGGLSCADKVSELSAGPESPPFHPSPEPVFRTLFAWEMAQHRPTMDVDISDWRVTITNITCDETDVMKPVEFPTAIPSPLDGRAGDDRQCNGDPMPEVDWAALADQAWQSPGAKCQYAPNACVCAAIPNCGWFPSVGAGGTCRAGGPVSCDHCPIQAGCTPEPATLCAAEIAPCPCVASTGECRWDVATKTCVVQEAPLFTPCTSCARQLFCPAVEVDRIMPRPMSVIGQSDVGWQINVTFTRQVWLVSAEASVMLQCGTGTSNVRRLSVPYSSLTTSVDVLHVNLTSVVNERIMDCDLLIGSGTLKDRDHIPFSGYEAGLYTITFPDTAPPTLLLFDPANSDVEIPLDVTVEFTFSEDVAPGPDAAGASITLLSLGTVLPDGSRGADVEVARLAMTGSSVSFDEMRLRVDLDGLLEPGLFYSLSIPSGSILDTSGNVFAGLDPAVYAFRTEGVNTRVIIDEGLSTEMIIGIAVAAGAVVIIIASSTLIYMRVSHMRQRIHAPHPDKETAPPTSDPVDAHFLWGGEQVVGKQVEPTPPKSWASGHGVKVKVLQVGPASPKSWGAASPSSIGPASPKSVSTQRTWGGASPNSTTSPPARGRKAANATQSEPLSPVSPKSVRSHPHLAAARAAWSNAQPGGEASQPNGGRGLGATARGGAAARGSPAPPETAPPVARLT